ncbi:Na(+)/citrate cotransporter-like [Ostrea edulis]|uniref:Na(+)/citrate cotransporter-like n=1 Tax=Ostrea edulis TaxID=37623 RepID=UPI0024AE97BE|nr:Na(+)/citrate cotransporter-like [Ostrea edulis]XP_048754119.2 Na(+)/citrate cotransporter-like [Ostrea edulis]XP_056008165.1 Na(+)/citrate cotransporter-like [Ostrea edulis]
MPRAEKVKTCLKIVLQWRTVFIVFLLPLVLLPIALSESKVARAAYGVLIIAIFWVFEVLPLAVTSLLPVVIFPLLGVAKVSVVCSSYFKDTLMLFLGSLIVAVAVEKWNLHKRIALRALTLVGPNPRWLMLGIMLPCWFLSMWMSNTATTAMMVPILSAILHVMKESMTQEPVEETELVEQGIAQSQPNGKTVVETLEGEEVTIRDREKDEESRDSDLESTTPNETFIRLTKTFALCTAYAANIGGMATLTGTPPNIILKTIADEVYEKTDGDSGITFANWLIIGFPLSLICLIITWLWLQVFFAGRRCFQNDSDSYESVRLYLRRAYKRLGPMTFQEKVVLIVFIVLALLWMTRKPEVVPGWGSLFEKGYTGDSIAAVAIAAFLFAFPSHIPCVHSDMGVDEEEGAGDNESNSFNKDRWKFQPLLDWETVNQKIPWGVLLLMGGGFAVAAACESSGLSEWVSSQLALVMKSMSTSLGALLLSLMVAAATNVTSNSATATLFLPIVGNLAIDLGIHPLAFMVPVAISCSFAFMLPVGTPPNAIVFSTGYLKVKDMVMAGSFVNLVTVLVMILAMVLWITPFYNLDEFPAGFLTLKNQTVTAVNGTISPYNITSS